MPAELPASTQALACSMLDEGQTVRNVAHQLSISSASAGRLRHQALLDPDLIHHANKHLSNKLLLVSNGATDELLDKALNGELKKEKAIELAKIASITAQASVAFATVSGGKDTLSGFMAAIGVEQSHSVSKVTMTQQISVETAERPTTNCVSEVIENP